MSRRRTSYDENKEDDKIANNNNNNSRGDARCQEPDAEFRAELRTAVKYIPEPREEIYNRAHRVQPPEFCNLQFSTTAQMLPQVCDEFFDNGLALEPYENKPEIALPEFFFQFNSKETSMLLSVLLDSSDTRLTRLMNHVHIRATMREDRYYQIVDDPVLYSRSKCQDVPAFHNRVVLYLTTPGVLIYLKATDALNRLSNVRSKGTLPRTMKMETRRESRQSKRRQPQSDYAAVLSYEKHKREAMTPFINVDAYQYATYVHCCDGDILRFQLDYLAVKRHYQEALPILMEMNWQPNSPSLLLYRRRYYQYMTPFLDWVDMMRYQLKTSPTLPVTGFYEKLLDKDSEAVDLEDLKFLGETMLECMELRRLTKGNCSDPSLRGMYAGRRVYRDKDPWVNLSLKNVFGSTQVVRPVLPHACSVLRRFLVQLSYYERPKMTSMPQVLALVEFLLHQDFFSMHPLCRSSTIRLEPLVFQIYDFVWSIRKGNVNERMYLRNESWNAIKESEDAYAWYRRWDVFNCICLLFSICQNALENAFDESIVERVVRITIDVLRASEYLEPFYSYSYYDTYLGVSSAVNCVPNLSLACLLRVLRTVPIHMCHRLSVSQVLETFSDRFWRSGSNVMYDSHPEEGGDILTRLPRTLHEISQFLLTRPRRISVRQAPVTDTSDSVSGMSAMGSTGAVVLFYRDFNAMPFITPENESAAVSYDRMDATRRAQEERQHLAEYRKSETDYRYGQLFAEAYVMATGRPRMELNESLTYRDCASMSKQPFTLPQRF